MRRERFIDQFGGRVIAFRPEFADIGGGALPGLFLSQAFYWQRVVGVDEWWWKTREEWHTETRLTRYQQETARKKLKEAGLLEEERRGSPATMHFRVRVGALMAALGIEPADPDPEAAGGGDDVSPEDFSWGETNQLDGGEAANQMAENPPTHHHQSTASDSARYSCPRSARAGQDSPAEAGEDAGQVGDAPPELEDEAPEVRAAREAGLARPSVKERLQAIAKGTVTTRTRRAGRKGQQEEDLLEIEKRRATRDRREAGIEGPSTEQSPENTIPPERDDPLEAWVGWAESRIVKGKGRRARVKPPCDWTPDNLATYFNVLVEGYLDVKAQIVDVKVRGRAASALKQLGGDECKAMVDWLMANWIRFKRDYDINARGPTIGLLVGFSTEIRNGMEGKGQRGGSVGGRDRDTGKWEDDEYEGEGW